MVGTGGFEPPTPYTPSRCAARLRHVPLRPEPRKFISTVKSLVKTSSISSYYHLIEGIEKVRKVRVVGEAYVDLISSW